jgi:hypothetical protein
LWHDSVNPQQLTQKILFFYFIYSTFCEII